MDTSNASRTDFQSALQRSMSVTVCALMVNTVLALTKLVIGWMGGSYALLADGVESCADACGSLVVWGGLKIASKPADEDHPYGHGRAETLAALFVTIMLLAAGVFIAVQAVKAILHPRATPAVYTLAVLLGVVIVKEALFRFLHRTASEEQSTAVLADAWHHRCDAITSAAAALGISVALIGGPGYESADAWAALIAAVVIVVNAAHLARVPISELMDVEPTELLRSIDGIAESLPHVDGVEKVTARKTGVCYWVDMHVEVDPEMTVSDAHEVAHEVQHAIRTRLPSVAGVLVHIEPAKTVAHTPST